MFCKIIATVLVVAFAFVQFGSALQCYSCTNPASCQTPMEITCTTDNANATTLHLHSLFTQNLTSMAANSFNCFHHNYTSVANNVTYSGCVYRPIAPCSLTLKPEHSALKQVNCYTCSGDRCNPAGTFSSSVITMFASMLLVGVYKILKM